jgi:hypothetical protein
MARIFALTVVALAGLASGCGTTRMTDSLRSGSEMRLISQAIDMAVARLSFTELAGKPVFLDTQYLDGTVDKGYLISSLRQRILADGALLQESREKATFVVEARSGGVGTDKYSLLVGMPAMSLPNVLPGVPTSIPEIALIKKSDQQGIAKIAVFAYNRQTGKALWQSDVVESMSNLKDTWFFGAGPYRRGSIQRDSEFAGESIPKLPAALHVFPGGADPMPTPPAVTEAGPPPGPRFEVPRLRDFGSTLFGDNRQRLITRPVAWEVEVVVPAEVVGPPWPPPAP